MNCHITYAIKVILALWSFYHSVQFRIDVLIIKENMTKAMTIKNIHSHCHHYISHPTYTHLTDFPCKFLMLQGFSSHFL